MSENQALSGASSVEIQLNGENHAIAAQMSLASLIESLGLDQRKVAVERNLEIVPRSTYAETLLGQGDRLEIVHFVGGG